MDIKKLVNSLMLCFSLNFLQAQWATDNPPHLYYNSGNVGIGTSSPTDKLEVYNGNIVINRQNDGGWTKLIFNSAGVTLGTLYNTGGAPDMHLDAVRSIFFTASMSNTTPANPVRIGPGGGMSIGVANASLNMYDIPSDGLVVGGNVGIGTTTPSNRLTVVATAEDVAQFKNVSTANTRILVANNTGQINLGIGSANPNGYLWCSTGKIFIGDDGSSPTMFVDGMSNGNVGIGTTDTKGYKLAVNGSAIFTKAVVKLYANWGDYVFDKDYHLPSLQEIEQFIQTHKRLPEMPSAAEVEKNGLDLGDNQTLVVKKIEELTLYIINQQKQIDELKLELKKIRKKK
jgi:hypothetical protein